MERLQILVNHHNEPSETVKRFLGSLDAQTGVEFEVLMLSDGGPGIPIDDLSGHRYPIRYAHHEHVGVCGTRNVLFDASDAPVVMFADIDDCFHANGLRCLMDAIRDADVACAPFLCEDANGSTRVMDRDTLHVHAKVFRRRYLVDNDIRYPDMEYSGDMAFLWLAFALGGRIRWVRDCFYTWKWNPSSVTRALPHFHVRAYGTTLRCYTLLGRDLRRRNRPDLLKGLVCTTFAMIYIDVAGDLWPTYPDDLRSKANQSAVEFLREFWEVYASADDAYRLKRYGAMVDFLHAEGHTGAFWDMERRLALMAGRGERLTPVAYLCVDDKTLDSLAALVESRIRDASCK